ncbi:MAG: hypothetical protein IPO05_18625 [Flavobacteriales bacterium]|nr:hypothetical protein [Flavobacteriales bacterium]
MRCVLIDYGRRGDQSFTIIGQGSDTGVYTAGPIVEIPPRSPIPPRRKYGIGTMHCMTFSHRRRSTPILKSCEIGFGITDRWGVQLRVPYMTIEGDLGSNSGVGDPVLTSSYAFIKEMRQLRRHGGREGQLRQREP